jgi:hypothetical protein
MRKGQLYVNGIAQRQGFAQGNTDGAMDSIDPLFDWQKKVGLTSSRFGAAPAEPTHDNWGPIRRASESLLHDGRQSIQLEGQSVLEFRSQGEYSREAHVRLLLV